MLYNNEQNGGLSMYIVKNLIYTYSIRYCYWGFTIIGETIQVFLNVYGGALPYNV